MRNATATTPSPAGSEYAELKRRIKAARLLDPQPAYYLMRFAGTFALYAVAVAAVIAAPNTFVLLLSAVLLGFAFTQVGLLGHDLGHRQLLRRSRWRALLSLLVGNLMIGVSYSWWVSKHNRHHAHPNDLELDPDVDIAPFAFSPTQVESRPWLFRKIVAWQAAYFWLVIPFQGLNFRWQTVRHLLARPLASERIAFLLHFVLYALLLVAIGDPMRALAFVVVHQGFFGLYNSLIFAPNHKGMPLVREEDGLGFLREQVLTSRNVRGGPLVDLWYGGLNYQIEHHLFPSMPRNRLQRAVPIVRRFCEERGIPYCETNVVGSYRQIFGGLRSAPRDHRGVEPIPARPTPLAARQAVVVDLASHRHNPDHVAGTIPLVAVTAEERTASETARRA